MSKAWYGLAITIAVSLTVACEGQVKPQIALPPLGEIHTVDTISEVMRPVDAYLPTTDQIKILIQATDDIQAECMRGFGLQSTPWTIVDLDDLPLQIKARNPIYGYFVDEPSDRGYDRTGNIATLADPVGDSALAVDSRAVFYGADDKGAPVTEYHGKVVPAGGCRTAGLQEIGGLPSAPDPTMLPGGGPRTPQTDPRLVDVYKKWSSCMKAKGFNYASPMAAYLDAKWAPPPGSDARKFVHSALENAVATADLTCKRSVNLMGVALAVEAAYDKQYIEVNRKALDQYRSRVDEWTARAAEILADAGAARGT